MWRDGACDPDARTDYGVMPHDRLAAQHGGVCVDDDMIFDRGMTLGAAHEVAVGIRGKAQGTERHALVELDPLADLGRLPDDHARAVIDEEVLADRGPRMDVDARAAMGPL